MPTDPVCGMYVPETSNIYTVVDGEKIYFCSKSCMQEYTSPDVRERSLKSRLEVAWAFAIPVLILTYFFQFPFKDYVLLALALPVQLYSGYVFYQGAYMAVKSRSGNMDLLITIGTVTAFVFSIFITLFPRAITSAGVYFDASAFIITLILTGNYVENSTKKRANRSAARLVDMIPATSHFINSSGDVTDRSTSELSAGDRILVKPGELFPCDGKIYEGLTEVDQSILTGEQEPVTRREGDDVYSGTSNLNGSVKVTISKTGKNTTVGQIYDMIRRAATGRAKVQKIADRFSAIFIPIVLSVAFASSIFWVLFLTYVGSPYAIEIAVLSFVSVVVIACPCAIGLAGPITMLISSSISSENGIVIKNAGSLDRLAKATRVVFDKTGTLTESEPEILSISVQGSMKEESLLAMAAAIEMNSNHPVAKAITVEAKRRNLNIPPATGIIEIPGTGIEGKAEGRKIRLERSFQPSGSAVDVFVDGNNVGSIHLGYRIRHGSKEAVDQLKSIGLSLSVLSGDSEPAVADIAAKLGITDIHAGVLPGKKAEVVKQFQADGDYVIFVGDGINDTVALETADVGIAMGSGSEIARNSGDLIILSNDLGSIPKAIVIAGKTVSKIRQNIFWAISYNSALIPVAAGILVPVFGLTIYSILPMLAALAMGFSSTTVVMNSILMKGRTQKVLRGIGNSAVVKQVTGGA
ncbi:putative copper-exporting P-type ATPase A [Thermoplasmatales archaeon]|nr:putative copper-exporting P-type ATPase A [Thermoplasmatales archaeon]